MKKIFKTLMIVALCGAAIGMVSCNKDDDNGNNNDPNGVTSGEWIDLGLPSGLLWRAYNLGATTPEGYGGYYAWGETSTKDTYSWSNYRFATMEDSHPVFSKYQNDSLYAWYHGPFDGKTTLEAEDDAATVVLGNGSRIPTVAEWNELLDNVTFTWTTLNNVKGCKFTSTANGNSIFLPAAGLFYSQDYDNVGEWAAYWTSSLDTLVSKAAYILEFIDGHFSTPGVLNEDRYCGLSIRAVRSAR